jgi:hypothetical protein
MMGGGELEAGSEGGEVVVESGVVVADGKGEEERSERVSLTDTGRRLNELDVSIST